MSEIKWDCIEEYVGLCLGVYRVVMRSVWGCVGEFIELCCDVCGVVLGSLLGCNEKCVGMCLWSTGLFGDYM